MLGLLVVKRIAALCSCKKQQIFLNLIAALIASRLSESLACIPLSALAQRALHRKAAAIWQVHCVRCRVTPTASELEGSIQCIQSTLVNGVYRFPKTVAMRPIQDMLRGAGRLCPSSITRSLHPKKAGLQPGRSLRRLRTAAVLQSRVQPVAVPAASGRAVVGGGVTDPTVEVAPPTNDEVQALPAHPYTCFPSVAVLLAASILPTHVRAVLVFTCAVAFEPSEHLSM